MAEVYEGSLPTAKTSVNNDAGFLQNMVAEVINSPLNMLLVALIAYLLFKIIVRGRSEIVARTSPDEPKLPKLHKDFTIQELKAFDGTQADGRVLVAVNGHVYDVSKGRKFYGPGEHQIDINE